MASAKGQRQESRASWGSKGVCFPSRDCSSGGCDRKCLLACPVLEKDIPLDLELRWRSTQRLRYISGTYRFVLVSLNIKILGFLTFYSFRSINWEPTVCRHHSQYWGDNDPVTNSFPYTHFMDKETGNSSKVPQLESTRSKIETLCPSEPEPRGVCISFSLLL